MRRPIIAGNWKMNNTIAQGTELVEALIPLVKDNKKVDIVVCPTATALAAVAKATEGTNVHVGAQNVHWEKSGAFTGELSTEMLTEIGVEYVILGHSERREYFGETNEGVNKRAKAALAAGLVPIICCGETLEIRESGKTNEFVKQQVEAAIAGMSDSDIEKIVIAYEPIWAIGTGKTATFEQAEEVCAVIRQTVAAKHSAAADKMRIQYGGSVKPTTIDGLMEKPNVDGALVGGASLKAADFARIANFN